MSEPKAWALDISLVPDYSSDGSGPVRLSMPSVLRIDTQSLIALMDRGRCCGLATVRGSALLVLPVSFEPNLLVSPMYEPLELQAEDRLKLFGHDEAHLRLMLNSVAVASMEHAVASHPRTTAKSHRYWKIAPGRNGVAWPEWRQRGIAAIGCPDLGDITTLSEDDFQARSKAKYGKDSRPSRANLYQLYASVHRYDCRRAYLLYPRAVGVPPRDLQALARYAGDHAGTVDVRFVDLNRKLWTREGKKALAEELAVIVREGLGLIEAAPLEAVA